MILSRRLAGSTSLAGPASLRITGRDDKNEKKYVFCSENIVTRRFPEEEKPLKTLELLDDQAFEFI